MRVLIARALQAPRCNVYVRSLAKTGFASLRISPPLMSCTAVLQPVIPKADDRRMRFESEDLRFRI